MSATSTHRRIVVLHSGGREDVDADQHTTLAQLIQTLGVDLVPGRDHLLGVSGDEYSPDSLVGVLRDGSIVTVTGGGTVRDRERSVSSSAPTSALPWAVTVGALGIATASLVMQAPGAALPGGTVHLWLAGTLGLAAVALSAVWSRRAPTHLSAAAAGLAAPLTLSFAATAIAVPVVAQGTLVAVAAGLISMTACCTVSAVATRHRYLRALSSAIATVLVMASTVWAIPALTGWPIVVPALVTMGLGCLALRIIPALVINVPEGHFINYAHFMSHRWTVRGDVPADPGELHHSHVKAYLSESEARHVGATAAAAIVTALAAPLGVSAVTGPPGLDTISALVAYLATLTAFALSARRISTPLLRWALRATAFSVALSLAFAALHSEVSDRAVVGGLLALAVLTVALIVPLSRGVRWLSWSRVADSVEALCLTLALPAALLGANMIQLVRTMVS